MMTQNATPTISRVFVDEVLECALRADINIPSLLSALDLDCDALDRLSPARFAQLWLEASARMGDEFFGLGLRPMALGSFTLMGHAVRGARNFEVALHRAIRFLKVVIGEPYGAVSITEDICTVKLQEQGTPRSAFAYRTFFLILHGLNCWLVRERIPLLDIAFPCLEPTAGNDYGDFFGKPVRFGTTRASVTFDAKYLKRPVKRSEEELKTFLRTTPETFLRGYRPVLSLKQRIMDTCKDYRFGDWPTTEALAAALGFSKSTLHRRLRDEGQSIRAIKDEIRRSQVTYLLKFTDQPMSKIASQAGYAEASAFHRAFRRWYGTTPNEMRRANSVLKQER